MCAKIRPGSGCGSFASCLWAACSASLSQFSHLKNRDNNNRPSCFVKRTFDNNNDY